MTITPSLAIYATLLAFALLATGGHAQSTRTPPVIVGVCDASGDTTTPSCQLRQLTLNNASVPAGTALYIQVINSNALQQINYNSYAWALNVTGSGVQTIGWAFGAATSVASLESCITYLTTNANAQTCPSSLGVFFTLGYLPPVTTRGGTFGYSPSESVSNTNGLLVSNQQIKSATNNTFIFFTAQLSTLTTTNSFSVGGVNLVKNSAFLEAPTPRWMLLLAALLALLFSAPALR